MIGNLVDATLAQRRHFPMFDRGSARDVYLINGIIYKVETEEDANNVEFANLINITDIPANIGIPDFSMHVVDGRPVMAMEYISGVKVYTCQCFDIGLYECDCDTECILTGDILARLKSVGLTDFVYGNVIYDGETYWIVDGDIMSE